MESLIKEEDYDCVRDCLGLGYSRRECRDQCRDSTSHDSHPLDVDGDGKLTISEMKITRRQLRQIIRESIEQTRSREAISHSASQRDDGLSFVDFTGLIVDKLNLYDEWLSNKSVDAVVEELSCAGKISATFARKKYAPMKGDDTIYSRQAALDPRHTDSEGDF